MFYQVETWHSRLGTFSRDTDVVQHSRYTGFNYVNGKELAEDSWENNLQIHCLLYNLYKLQNFKECNSIQTCMKVKNY